MTIEEIVKGIKGGEGQEEGYYWYSQNHNEILNSIKTPADIMFIMKAMKSSCKYGEEIWHGDLDELLCKLIEIIYVDGKEITKLYDSFGKCYD